MLIIASMEFKNPVTELIRKRRSVRNYSSDVLDPATEQQIREVLGQYTKGPMGNRVTFHLVQKPTIEGKKIQLGTYGFIKGAQYFVAGEVRRAEFAEEDFGYLLEIIMLHMLEKGLGTCWLGGTFKRSKWAKVLNISTGMVIPAITPLGYPALSMSKREQLVRTGAKSDRRKSRDELFFAKDFGEPLACSETDNSFIPLEMVRLAPSASNKQPWRVVKIGENFHFFLSRTPGYGSFANNIDIQHIDMGIAMAHFELSSREVGLEGGWEMMDHRIPMQEGIEYIVSWKRDNSAG